MKEPVLLEVLFILTAVLPGQVTASQPATARRPAHLQRHKLAQLLLEPRSQDPSLFDSGKVECPMVIRRGDEWWMYYTGIQIKEGVVHSTLGRAVSKDLVHWTDRRRVLDRGAEGAFDHGGISGPFVFEASRRVYPGGPLRTDEDAASDQNTRLYMVYVAFPRLGYETRPGRQGLAWSDDGIHWTRAAENPIRDVAEKGTWDDECLYKPFVMRHDGKYWMFYNAYGTKDHCEQIGLATAGRVQGPWTRHPANPLLRKGDPAADRDHRIIGDPWIMRSPGGNTWEMYYFAFDGRHARECLATSTDLIHWTKSPFNPIMDAGLPGTYDGIHCHKPSIVVQDDVYYHFFTACGPDGKGGEHRAIGLATSKRVEGLKYRD
jgi:beta-xylosidase